MAQEKLTLSYSQAYFQDRVKELRNQVPNGDPFVFVGAIILLNSLANHANVTMGSLLGTEYSKVYEQGLERLAENIGKFFALYFDGLPGPQDTVRHKIAFSHDDNLHLQNSTSEDGTMISNIISANKFLDTISQAINAVFDAAREDEMLALRLYLNINERRLFGHGK